ncbi:MULTISPECIES: hypothetical protein [Burkholderia]|uniref:Lipoprotein n=1 Tax=Burkholderia contaminans TaxID=488447 RepID=A0A2S5E8P3_9BURK|nr:MULTISPECIES: hypothetical protein [Burkholderia]EKS9795816.1 hypothetical protein [Burkholderia cepacia]EKS9803094.1 hypothetical protein [Burkholderia cepacia]EKS9810578.1 hypothetical protein [Burkholderia cepacia]EKS9821558.1 hypothetical protein [Burkholderia cepacia]EKS9826942.1 hypothetical protein [Burkholderia cepacia]
MKRLLPSASLAAAMACALALSACAAQSTVPAAASAPAEAAAPPAPPMPGSDRDPHGCIPSAGYSWCEQTQQCERPWELAKQKGFANSALAYEQFCRNNFAK